MIDMVLSLALPLLVALAVSGVVRLSAGTERGARLMGVGLGVGFLGWWLWANGVEPLGRLTPLGTAPLVTLAGLAAGAAVNAWAAARRTAAWAVAAVFAVLSLWALAGLPVSMQALAAAALPAAGLALLFAVVLGGLGTARERAPWAPALLLAVACAGLGATASALGAGGVSAAALALAVAVLGVLPWLPAAPGAPGWIVTLSGGGTFVALAAALLAETPGAAGALAVLALVFLAEPTAARLPAGGPRTALLARPGWLVLVAALPAGLAGLLAQVAAKMVSG
ncbi:hypothetical protein [Caenispirillum salinarum]|uniref:hypothetical protein n=1 Tax=Caenispirillum salinarum TaxID=859058 RepID=UPI00384D6A35